MEEFTIKGRACYMRRFGIWRCGDGRWEISNLVWEMENGGYGAGATGANANRGQISKRCGEDRRQEVLLLTRQEKHEVMTRSLENWIMEISAAIPANKKFFSEPTE
jgi:hypothetical protein